MEMCALLGVSMVRVKSLKLSKLVLLFLSLSMCLILLVPVQTYATAPGFIAVSCGDTLTLALRGDGTVWMWGVFYGQPVGNITVGFVSSRDYPTPIQIPISNVIAISAGGMDCIALKSDGTVWAWGDNEWGELGDGTNMGTDFDNPVPVQVKGLNDVVAISAGSNYNIALKSNGTVWGWGYNEEGNLGNGTFENCYVPVQIKGLTNITAISGGSYAIKDDGTVWTWGLTLLPPDNSGQMEYSNITTAQELSKTTPYMIPGLTNIKTIDVDDYYTHTVFVKNDGTVWNWGYDIYGELGDGSSNINNYPYKAVPVQVSNLTDVKTVATGAETSMALKNDGTVWVWGANSNGQEGIGSIGSFEPVPVQIPSLNDVVSMATKDGNSVFLKNDGSVWVCGNTFSTTPNFKNVNENSATEGRNLVPVEIFGPNNETLNQPNSTTLNTASTGPPAAQNNNSTTQLMSTPAPSPGFDFNTIMILTCIGIITGLVCGMRSKK